METIINFGIFTEKYIMKNKGLKCKRCSLKEAFCKGFCARCYYATRIGYEITEEKVARRNYIENNKGVLSDENGKKWLVDLDIFELTKHIVWYDNGDGYACSTPPGFRKKRLYLHKFIKPDFKIVDHINKNTFDNRRINLRDGGNGVNRLNQNRPLGESGVRGISKDKKGWRVRFSKNGKEIFSKYFRDLESAKDKHKEIILKNNLQEFYL